MFDLAIYYRMVGGFVGLGPNHTTECRLRWAFTMACYMALVGLVHHLAFYMVLTIMPATIMGAYVGRLIPHARFQAGASLGNSLGMAAINVARIALIVAPYAFFSSWWHMGLAAFGVLAGVAYYAGWKWLDGKDSGIYWRNADTQYQTGFPSGVGAPYMLDHAAWGGSEWGELLTGWLVYQAMFVVALVWS